MHTVIAAVFFCLLTTSFSVYADNQRPSVVNNVSAEGTSGPAIVVSWNRARDNVGVDGYNVYRDGGYLKTVWNTTNYIDRDISRNRNYRYAVVAFDRARNYSVMSGSASASSSGGGGGGGASSPPPVASAPPPANGTPSPPGNLRADVQSSSSAKLSWSTPSGGAEGYNVYRDGNYYTTVKGRNDYTARSLDRNKSYTFQVVAFRNNRYSTKSASVTVRTSGNEASEPSQPESQPSTSSDDSAVPNGYSLVFSDDFNGSDISSSKWNTRYRWGPDWIINNEAQYYIDRLNDRNFGANPFEHNGNQLTIKATKTPGSLRSKARNQRYLSGAMTTFGKFHMRYGYVEMRAKLPKGRGLWPAFWLLHESNDRRKPEIDVMENLGHDTRLVYQTYHYYDNGNLHSTPSFKAPGPDYSSDFHTFGMLWEPGKITWYVDGKRTNRYEHSKVSDENMYLLINLALGGSWAGNPNSDTRFPARYVIDYVRAYQKR